MDKHCRICHNTSCSNHGKNISFLGDRWKCNYIPVPTNADRIRAMSDEELAELIVVRVIELKHPFVRDLAYSAWLKWLQQPAEGE